MAVGDGQQHCAECGTELSTGARFCRNCGRGVSAAVESPPAGGAANSNPLQDAEPSPGTEKTTFIPVVPPREQLQEPPPAPRRASAEGGQRHSNLRDAKWVIVAGVVALVIIAGVVVFLLHSGSSPTNATAPASSQSSTTLVSRTTVPRTTTSTSTTTTIAAESASQEAAKINFLLAESSNDRNEIVSATNDISNCGNLSQDESTLNSAAQSRQLLINELPKLQIAQVPGGAQLIAALTSAWQASRASDSSYAAWAGDLLQSGCTPGQSSQGDPNWQAAQTSDAQATSAKTQSAALWAPIATAYNLPQYTYSQL
jgi:zinc-ribbon domain